MSHSLHKAWLKVAAIVVASFGPVFFLGSIPDLTEPARLTLDLLSWPIDGATTYQSPDTQFLSALTGGFLLGWGVLIWCLSGTVYDVAPEGVRRSVLASLISWFILDSAGSAMSGNESNVLFNVLILVVASGPLWVPSRKSDKTAEEIY